MKPSYLLWFTHQKLHVIALVASTFAFLDGFFPLAEGEQFNTAITHLSGLPKLLYLLPLVTLIIAIMALYRRIHSTAWWYLVVGVIGVLIGLVAIAACVQNVNRMEGDVLEG